MRVTIENERYDLRYLISAAIKTTYHTRSPGGVERCIHALNHLKSLSLSVKDIQLSRSIVKLECLRSHRNPKIREEAKALFLSWSKTLYTQGRDNSFEAGLNEFRLKPKKPVLTRSSKSKKKEDRDACEAVTMKKPCRSFKDDINQNIKDKNGQVTTKTIPWRSENQQQIGPVKDSANPKSPALKTKIEEKMKKNLFYAFQGRPSKFKKAKLIRYRGFT